jgi:hypothetical protein
MHAGLITTFVEGLAELRSAAADGTLRAPPTHAAACAAPQQLAATARAHRMPAGA